MLLSDNIRLIRKRWRYKQEEFGALFEVKGQSISTYEKGTAEPKISFLLKLSERTGISVNDLCSGALTAGEIPEKPLYPANREKSAMAKEPSEKYELSEPEEESDALFNMQVLVTEFKKLSKRVSKLENKQEQQED